MKPVLMCLVYIIRKPSKKHDLNRQQIFGHNELKLKIEKHTEGLPYRVCLKLSHFLRRL